MTGIITLTYTRNTFTNYTNNTMNKIRLARESKNMTQLELSKRIGCTQVHISALETGKNYPSRQIAKKIAEVLEIPVINVLYPED